jgi:hypothetical protein
MQKKQRAPIDKTTKMLHLVTTTPRYNSTPDIKLAYMPLKTKRVFGVALAPHQKYIVGV